MTLVSGILPTSGVIKFKRPAVPFLTGSSVRTSRMMTRLYIGT